MELVLITNMTKARDLADIVSDGLKEELPKEEVKEEVKEVKPNKK
jgi:hypothetical protein